MNKFDIIHNNYQHKFVKENPKMLNHLFGTTDVMPLWIADMDFKIASEITEELHRLVNRGIYAYEFDSKSVFNSITSWNKNRHNLELNSRAFIQVTGVLTGISLLIRELTKEEDGILIQTPVYHQFEQIIKTANRKVVKNPLKIVNGNYEMDFEDLEEKLKTKSVQIIILCNPHNPVGRVWNKQEINQLIHLADKHGVTIISDEIHSDIIYGTTQFNSIASFDQTKHITVLGSPAKTFGMQSISNGYLYIQDETIFKQIKHIAEAMYLNHGNAFTTFATIAAYTKGETWVNELIAYLEETLDWITQFMKKDLPQIKWFSPQGTYQIWMDFSELQLTNDQLNELLFKKAKLGLTPGGWFGKEFLQFMRMNIASPKAKIQQAFQQLKEVINENL
ncbi:MalY/PatB family protein [Tenacibaculum amylolyticum]|uniref:MalY/PatB family protein n=1 Tax=Tenacibaculum amylolyticum TaxID=104269 RepID=UPI003893BA05